MPIPVSFTLKTFKAIKQLWPSVQPLVINLVNLALFLYKLNTLDLGPIAHQLIYPNEGQGWTFDQTRSAIAAYKRFLLSHYLNPDRAIRPTKTIDRVWHAHILDTQKYLKDCDRLFGYVLHHFPYGQA